MLVTLRCQRVEVGEDQFAEYSMQCMHKFPFKSQLHAKIAALCQDLSYSAAWDEVEVSS